jgi:hypothetical protein
MDTLVCPYCDSEVKISMVEAEEGCCPECGSSISTAANYNSYNDDDEESELDDNDDSYDDEDNDFGDEEDEDIDEEEYEDTDEEDEDKYV